MSSRHQSPVPNAPAQEQYQAEAYSRAQAGAGQAAALLPVRTEPDTALQDTALSGTTSSDTARPDTLASRIEARAVELAIQYFDPAARIAIFVIYFWFGFLKAIGVSPATPLAQALTAHTIGMQYFNISFKALAVYECGLGILFLIRPMTRISVVLLLIHMGIVTSPLIIVANVAWTHPLVPTLEGQYIIKDLAIIALAIGILAWQRLGFTDRSPQPA